MIITLILLGVVTFMAIAFLALSRRERGAVTTVTDTASARLAADTALAGAEAQIVANILSTNNPYSFGLLVSTNYINPAGFTNGGLNDVNYYDSSGNFLTGNSFLQNLANLYYNPRPPVFIPNPVNPTLPPDFRYYLDLNRNGRFETNGWVLNVDNLGHVITDSLGNTLVYQVGDPEWIGILQRPDQPYGPNNPFVARYAFIALPVGNTLDLNAIYNDAMMQNSTMDPGKDSYFRNQGVGSWEINLAAFLTDLNTDEWDPLVNPYIYDTWNGTSYNQGAGFEDALSLLKYRYGGASGTYNNLATVDYLFGGPTGPGDIAFKNDNIDGYSDGPLQITLNTNEFLLPDVPSKPWAGADNMNHFFTHQELFDPTKSSIFFTNRLWSAGTSNSTYDRYTFYRLLSQLGTDSTPESGRMNLNYDNLTTNGPPGATNFVSWQPLAFFTNAADRLLRAYTTEWRNSNPTNFATTFYSVANFTFTNPDQWINYPAFGITNIPVWVSNRFVYSSAVNRLLQLAANMYDATTTNFYPSVFRPLFTRDSGGNVFVTGYAYVPSVTGTNDPSVFTQPFDASTISALVGVTTLASNVNVYGVPWIIGAKKGFPNFNKFTMQNVVQITRKLQIARSTIPTTSISDLIYTNQMYIFSISNSIGMDCWNSYSGLYPNLPNQLQIVVHDNLSMMLTNDGGALPVVFSTFPLPYPINTNITLSSSWPGSAWNPALYNGGTPALNSFIVPINNTVVFLPNEIFYSGTMPPGALGFHTAEENLGWETNKHDFTLPNFGLLTTNRLQVFMLDKDILNNYHVIDYAHFAGPDSSRNLKAEFQTSLQTSGYENLWSTSSNADGVPWGIISQIDVSDGNVLLNTEYWNDGSAPDEISGFRDFMGLGTANGSRTAQFYATNYIVQVPYSPTVTAYDFTSWQANDPLVHYLAGDLNFQGTDSGGPTTGINVTTKSTLLPRPSFKLANDRYSPWGRSLSASGADPNPYNLAFKDPLVRYSDNWDFPGNKFPTVGWLGRVHRGTPWQTVYLKATNILNEVATDDPSLGINTWMAWTGNFNITNATYNAPGQDRLLFDLFTTAFNDNATRGTLSVNQSAGSSDPLAGLAAWSAVFSSTVALSNNAADDSAITFIPQHQNSIISNTFVFIQPAGPDGINSALGQLVAGINQTRANTNLFPLQSFAHAGDILSVPQLTEQSPFLHWWDAGLEQPDSLQQTNGISDEMYEWLPQQVMSLLRASASPRYVIYCYGQTLKPAADSVYNSGGAFFGIITNYQIVSEIATRAVVRFNSTVTNVVTTDSFGNWISQPVVTNNNAVIESFNILPPD